MAHPGWYPDPAAGGSRYWDGQAWTDRVVVDKPPGKGIPGWALIGWFVLMALTAFAGFWFVLLMTAFGCDSAWEGCTKAGESTWAVYAGISTVGLVGLLIWALVSKTPGPRVAAFILMPFILVVALVASMAAYMLLAQWLA